MFQVPSGQSLGPVDMALCQGVYNDIIADAGLDESTLDLAHLEATVLSAFQTRRDQSRIDLLIAVRARRQEYAF